MLEGAKSIGAGAATIALTEGCYWKRFQFFDSFCSAQSIIGKTIIWLCHFRLCADRGYCIVCSNDGFSDLICIPISK